jgi:hypothetical protein
MNIPFDIVITGLVATAVMDLWGFARKPLLGQPAADYRLVGRWLAGFPRGRFRHESIAKAPPAAGESLAGWLAHYLLGIGFAGVLIALAGEEWIAHPTLAPPLLFGLISVLVPFFIMQPAMGAGIAARRAARPAAARIQSLVTHFVFGFGLFAGGWATHLFNSTGD